MKKLPINLFLKKLNVLYKDEKHNINDINIVDFVKSKKEYNLIDRLINKIYEKEKISFLNNIEINSIEQLKFLS